VNSTVLVTEQLQNRVDFYPELLKLYYIRH